MAMASDNGRRDEHDDEPVEAASADTPQPAPQDVAGVTMSAHLMRGAHAAHAAIGGDAVWYPVAFNLATGAVTWQLGSLPPLVQVVAEAVAEEVAEAARGETDDEHD